MKYMGSKLKIANEILEVISKYKEGFENYVEPFSGGLNMMVKADFPNKFANDINPFLIAMWIELKKNGSLRLLLLIDKELYSTWRNFYNKEKKLNNYLILTEDNLFNYAMCICIIIFFAICNAPLIFFINIFVIFCSFFKRIYFNNLIIICI